ncbi:DUF192 domain-containing protein [Sphingopyxis indica]|uniref:DUF192 domain-containing protein n=2 Tax=Sphingopyxis indica TaxID=436663 RepID=A0A239GN66_9SPHN|nr:DUF192 domain-containing protein [Sphingopyxis indica]SNS70639.1 hypothetical protein SAMN06295955_10432 [Sphingopyxis indica]
MRAVFTALALSLAAPLASCSGGADAAADSAQTIPLTIAAADGKTHRFTVEVARSEEEQRKGLMFRTDLPAGTGMLFPFPKPKIASFWMKNTLIPLDMIFIRSDGSIDRIAENTIPESLEPVVSGGEVAAVLEVAGGTAAELGLDEDAKVKWADGK